MNNVVQIEAKEPHINVMTQDGNIHVIPASVFKRIIDGSLSIYNVDDGEEIMRGVFKHWLDYIARPTIGVDD